MFDILFHRYGKDITIKRKTNQTLTNGYLEEKHTTSTIRGLFVSRSTAALFFVPAGWTELGDAILYTMAPEKLEVEDLIIHSDEKFKVTEKREYEVLLGRKVNCYVLKRITQ